MPSDHASAPMPSDHTKKEGFRKVVKPCAPGACKFGTPCAAAKGAGTKVAATKGAATKGAKKAINEENEDPVTPPWTDLVDDEESPVVEPKAQPKRRRDKAGKGDAKRSKVAFDDTSVVLPPSLSLEDEEPHVSVPPSLDLLNAFWDQSLEDHLYGGIAAIVLRCYEQIDELRTDDRRATPLPISPTHLLWPTQPMGVFS